MDAEGTSDVFTKVFIENKEQRETDTHFRCSNGSASFNYRVLFNVKTPRKDNMLTVQLWDRDLFKSNDFIGEAQIDIQYLIKDAVETRKPITLNKKYWN